MLHDLVNTRELCPNLIRIAGLPQLTMAMHVRNKL
jgi:hypothetical protein